MQKMNISEAIESVIKEQMDGLLEYIIGQYETPWHDTELQTIEHESRDGYISHNNGGFMFTVPFLLSSFVSSGIFPLCGGDAFRAMAERLQDESRKWWIQENTDALQALGFDTDDLDSIHYHSLCEKDAHALAESLDEYERDYLDTMVYITGRAMYYSSDNWYNPLRERLICNDDHYGPDCVLFDLAYNLDEYGRDSKAENVFSCVIELRHLTPESIAETIKAMQEKA